MHVIELFNPCFSMEFDWKIEFGNYSFIELSSTLRMKARGVYCCFFVRGGGIRLIFYQKFSQIFWLISVDFNQ